MSRLAELKDLIQTAETTGNEGAYNCLIGLFYLASAEVVDRDMYETILRRIKENIPDIPS